MAHSLWPEPVFSPFPLLPFDPLCGPHRFANILYAYLYPVEMRTEREHTNANDEVSVQYRATQVHAVTGVDRLQHLAIQLIQPRSVYSRSQETKRHY